MQYACHHLRIVRQNLAERFGHELPLKHQRVWHGEASGVDALSVVEKYVDVYQPVFVLSAG